jgi:hypothetical protein
VTDVAEHVVLQVECLGEADAKWIPVDAGLVPVSCAHAEHWVSRESRGASGTNKAYVEGCNLIEQPSHFKVYLLRHQQEPPEVACACDSIFETLLSDFRWEVENSEYGNLIKPEETPHKILL